MPGRGRGVLQLPGAARTTPPGSAGRGFDLLNLANNHAWDFGAAGQRQTVDALKRHRLAHTGRPGEITVLRRRGIRIAAVGFAPYPWANDPRARGAARDLVRAADKRADLVIVLAHLGGEGADQTHVPPGREVAMGEERGDTRAFAHGVVEAGADLVLGSGPHVLRGIEVHRGKLIAYSLGNFAGWHNFSTTGTLALSGILEVNLSKTGALRGGRFTSAATERPRRARRRQLWRSEGLVGRLSVEDFGEKGLRLLDSGSF